MRLPRIPHDPAALADFFSDALATLGAVVDRSWHDRLEVLAEGPSARLWNQDGLWHETQLRFLRGDTAEHRDASVDVFPGCPLTFRLAERLVEPPSLDRLILAPEPGADRLPTADVLERLWRQQHPETRQWHLLGAPQPAFHFSLVALIRCEVQAIDQHWSLHRVAVSLADGAPDESLARALSLAQVEAGDLPAEDWPKTDLGEAVGWLRSALEGELAESLASLNARQRNHLRRELERIDQYFATYEQELSDRKIHGPEAAARRDQRLAAARAERERRRLDQIARHTLHVVPGIDAALMVAEPAWSAEIQVVRQHSTQTLQHVFIPRARRWSATLPGPS